MNIRDICIRDPFIYIENGVYYITGTHHEEDNNALFIFSGKDFEHLEKHKVFVFDNNKYVRHKCWAAELYKYSGKYYVFVTLEVINGKRGTYILTSDNPLYGYQFLINEPITPKEWMCLDGTLFIDSDDTPYVIFCREWLDVKDGEYLIAKISKDLTHLLEEPKLLFKASEPKWSFPIYGDKYVSDGPFIIKEKDVYHMIWSSFCKRDPLIINKNDPEPKEYCLSHITSDNVYGPYKQEEKPLINNNGGHGMIFKDKGEYYLSLHYPNSPGGKERLKLFKFDIINNIVEEKK